MSDTRATPATRQELLAGMDTAWTDLQGTIDDLGAERLAVPVDAAGWTGKDHLAHLTAWMRSMDALLQGIPRHTGLGVAEDVYLTHDVDLINDHILAATRMHDLPQVLAGLDAAWHALRRLVAGMTAEDLEQPYGHFLPDEPGADDGRPIRDRIWANTGAHFPKHQAYILAIARHHRTAAQSVLPRNGSHLEPLLAAMADGERRVRDVVARWGEARLSGPVDGAGWTGKDHLAHVTAWERSLVSWLTGGTRAEGLGVTEALFASRDLDAINDAVRQATGEWTLDQVLAERGRVRARLRDVVAGMTPADLERAYAHYPPDDPAASTPPVSARVLRVVGSHVDDHLAYIEALIAGEHVLPLSPDPHP